MFGLCCAYGMIMFNDPHNARHRGLGVKMNLSTAMLVGLLLALVSKVPVAIGGPDLNPVIFCASFVSVISGDIAEQLGIPNYPDTKRRLGFSLGDEIPGAGEILRQLGSGGSSDSGSTWCEGRSGPLTRYSAKSTMRRCEPRQSSQLLFHQPFLGCCFLCLESSGSPNL